VIQPERARLVAVQHDHTEDVLVGLDQRHQRRAREVVGLIEPQPARICLDVLDHDRLPVLNRPARQPFVYAQGSRLGAAPRGLLRPAQPGAEVQQVRRGIDRQDGPLRRAHRLGDHLQRAVEQALHVQAGRQLGRDLVERADVVPFFFQLGGALADALVEHGGQLQRLLEQARALDSDTQLSAHRGQNALVVVAEGARIGVVAHSQHADHLVAGEQRHAQEAARLRHDRRDAQVAPGLVQTITRQQQRRLAPEDRRELILAERARGQLQRALVEHRLGQREAQRIARAVVQGDVDHLGVGHAGKLRIDHREQFIQAVGRRERGRHVVDNVQLLDRAPRLGLQARVFDRDRGLAGHRARHADIIGAKIAVFVQRLDLDQPDRHLVDHQRDDHPAGRRVAPHQLALAGRQVLVLGAHDDQFAVTQGALAQRELRQADRVARPVGGRVLGPGADRAVDDQRVVDVVPQEHPAGVAAQRGQHLLRDAPYHLVEIERDGGGLGRLEQGLELVGAGGALLEQRGILDGDGRLAGDGLRQLDLLHREGARLVDHVQAQHADHLAAHDQRDQQRALDVAAAHQRPQIVAQRVVLHVFDHQRDPVFAHAQNGLVARQVEDGVGRQVTARIFDHDAAQHVLVVDVNGRAFRHAERDGRFAQRDLEDVLQIERLGQRQRHAVEQRQPLGLFVQRGGAGARLFEQLRVVERHRRLVGEGQGELLVQVGVEIRLALLDGQHADHLAFADQRRAQPVLVGRLRAIGETRIAGAHVADVDHLGFLGHLAEQRAERDLDTQADQLVYRGRVWLVVTARGDDPQLVAVRHAQPQRHAVVREHAAQRVQDQVDHLVGIERRGDLAGDLRQCRHLDCTRVHVVAQHGALGHVLDQQHDAGHGVPFEHRVNVIVADRGAPGRIEALDLVTGLGHAHAQRHRDRLAQEVLVIGPVVEQALANGLVGPAVPFGHRAVDAAHDQVAVEHDNALLDRLDDRLVEDREVQRFGVEPRLLDGQRRLAGDGLGQLDLRLGENAAPLRVQADRADHVLAHEQRHDHQRARAALAQHVPRGLEHRIVQHVVGYQRLVRLAHARDRGVILQRNGQVLVERIVRVGAQHQAPGVLVLEQHQPAEIDAQRVLQLVQHDLVNLLRIERFGQPRRDAVDQRHPFGLRVQLDGALLGLDEQPRLFDGDRRLVGDGHCQLDLGIGEAARLGRVQADGADHLAAHHQRHGHQRARAAQAEHIPRLLEERVVQHVVRHQWALCFAHVLDGQIVLQVELEIGRRLVERVAEHQSPLALVLEQHQPAQLHVQALGQLGEHDGVNLFRVECFGQARRDAIDQRHAPRLRVELHGAILRLGEQARLLDGDGGLVGGGQRQLDLGILEFADDGRIQPDGADHLAAHDHRDDHHGARVALLEDVPHALEARVAHHVRRDDRLLRLENHGGDGVLRQRDRDVRRGAGVLRMGAQHQP